ncbi:MAG: bifunctional glutamate N-acetyltransferase/amino-acid acetyltransferase ArgJ [Planctomycetota bacterium]|jgi:glutamate N-acetyltransferase / amino-acid N-acetyltransferase|nr:bifunctional glutamate N-acetyltransferase/amino-acid acetyltransferase ArgJ [Planctomycetota bacterium]
MQTPHHRARLRLPSDLPRGFSAATSKVGIRKGEGDDLALIVSDQPCPAAAVFTKNRFAASPIRLSRRHLHATGGIARAILINAGCANAATGERGDRDAASSAACLASELGCTTEEVLVNSTGVIGRHLPIDAIHAGIPELVARASSAEIEAVARAIMTTDSAPKAVERTIASQDGGEIRIVGIAKGSGMIHPNMATMIGVVLTDARLSPDRLDQMLRRSIEKSFNRISVDGDTSTNDSVFTMASGTAGEAADQALLEAAFDEVCVALARMIVADGEGASRVIEVKVINAASQVDAREVAETIGSSLLVRTAVAGGDPNWGRIIAALGRTEATFEPDRIRVEANLVPLFADGSPVEDPTQSAAKAFASERVLIEIDLASGTATETYLTCDLTAEYVRINAEYTT